MDTAFYTQGQPIRPTGTNYRSAQLLDRTQTLLHKLALSIAAEKFPALTPLDLLEPHILFTFTILSPEHRTPSNLSSYLGVTLCTINTVLLRLHQQGALQTISPICVMTPHGEARGLTIESPAHQLLTILPRLKPQTLKDIHHLTTITMTNHATAPYLCHESLCTVCEYFEHPPSHCHLLDTPIP